MNSTQSSRRSVAFTLVELLVVIGIIALLAALLLPALSASTRRAKQIVCENQLRQIGIAFQSFSHDHNSKFPMQVAVADGGSQEFVQNGYLVNGPFYFAFRHFQPLAGFLEISRILVCPADVRLPAMNFSVLQNSNVSYFVGVNADYSQPMSILSGDGNLAATSTIVRGIVGGRLAWTREQHQFKGNVLFSDGHVEEWNNARANTLASSGDFILPSIGSGKQSSQSGQPNFNPAASAPAVSPAKSSDGISGSPTNRPASVPMPSASHQDTRKVVSESSQIEISNPVVGQIAVSTNNSASVISTPGDDDSTMSPFDRQIAKILRDVIGWSYLLILLLFLLSLAYRIWRWSRDSKRED